MIQLEAERRENVEIAAGAIMMLQVVTDNIWGFAMCQFLAGCFIIRLNPALVKYAHRSFHGRMFGLSSAAAWEYCRISYCGDGYYSVIWQVYLLAGIIRFVMGFAIYWRHI